MSGEQDSKAQPRGRKDLASTAAATAFQKEFGAHLRERVVEQGEPFAIAQADTPHEIFHAMDIPVISNQWWSAYISAKRLANRYFGTMDELGYPANRCRYCSLGLACSLADDPASAPWGGLPKPTMLVARLTCDCIQQVFSQWAEVMETEFFALEAPAWQRSLPQWFRHSRDRWEEVYQPDRIELLAEEMRLLVARLEEKTGRRLDMVKLEHLMERINEQEAYLAEAARLIGEARPCPVSIVDQMPNTMIPQWHRGSDWAVEHARRFLDEVKERIAAGQGLAGERLRLMWIGAGLWHDTAFYSGLEAELGAVFVWSMYLPFAGAQYIRDLKGKPFEALASRICSMNEVLHLPPWMDEWMVSEAKRCAIDAAVVLMPPASRLSQSGTLITCESLRAAGVPVLLLDADMVDGKNWDHHKMVAHVGDFLRRECPR
jgi:benzoyl-CoA reductase subunit B